MEIRRDLFLHPNNLLEFPRGEEIQTNYFEFIFCNCTSEEKIMKGGAGVHVCTTTYTYFVSIPTKVYTLNASISSGEM